MRTTRSRVTPYSPRRWRLATAALAAGSVAALGLSFAAGPAHAAQVTSGGTTPVSSVPQQNICAIVACPVATTFSFHHAGYYTYAVATFPKSATGTVSYRLHCADGFTKTRSTPVAAYINLQMVALGEHPGGQTCTLTQSVHTGFTTTTKLLPPDGDELWPVEYVQFTNS